MLNEPEQDGCGCAARRAWLNQKRPGLGDAVARVAEPVKAALPRALDILAGLVGAALALWLQHRRG